MFKLKNILSELLNTYKVEADLWTNPEFNITDVLNQIRAVRKITIVTIITPEDYVQSGDSEYQKLKIKMVTRDDPKDDIEKITKNILTSDIETNSLRIPGIKNIKFKPETIKRFYAAYATFKNVGATIDAFAYYSIDSGANWQTLLVSVDGTVGDGSGNSDLLPTSSSWNVAKLYPSAAQSFENIMFKLTTASTTTKLEINDFSIEYRVLHKRTS